MIYLFYGTDRTKALEKALEIINKKISEKPNAIVFKVDSVNISQNILIEMCGGQGMFEQKYIVHLKDVLQDETSKSLVFEFIKEMKSSENIFIITEADIVKKDFSKLEKHIEKSWEFEKKKEVEKKENIFSLSDYLIARDKKNLWITYQKFKDIFAVEEIHGTLFWAFKNIIIASKTKSASEAGLKPFVYSNAKKASQKYSQKELEEKFWELTKLLSDARRGEGELDMLLEKWVLEI
jgi:DNA polymerase III delta subunit